MGRGHRGPSRNRGDRRYRVGGVRPGRQGQARRAGGWGGVLGDEGSAYRIAAAAINRVLRGIDGREPPTDLGAILAQAAGYEDPADLCLFARADRASGGQPLEAVIGALAPAVTRAAAEGQPEARAIAEDAGRELAGLAVAIARGLPLERPAVHGLGSVLTGDTPVRTACDRELRRSLGVGLLASGHGALVGALVLAHEAATGTLPLAGVVAGWGGGGDRVGGRRLDAGGGASTGLGPDRLRTHRRDGFRAAAAGAAV